ncbi:hypothetical protein BMG03_05730 [Thioclava nitratireducens]|uniref:Curli assembly protein CsgC n=1 Tax=Thioclava nitratireducens TaxID=1915078 RepID=A0ABM6IF84_9RHOB|nr:curli-like amyloid fiber formation chaperone CsgH [Thioclava nitratireducens]AQS47351.1 hypothetical protein BMG03_05730 [Thioclava nitratireducens]
MKLKAYLLAFLLVAPFQALADGAGRAWISLSKDKGLVTIETFSRLEPGHSGKYILEVRKSGPNGRSVNRQAGSVPVSDGDATGPLSTAKISLEANADLTVHLRVTDDEGRVFEDTAVKSGE